MKASHEVRQTAAHNETRRLWVFDRPLRSDGLFWQGLVLGLVYAFFETSGVGFGAQSLLGQALDLLGAVLTGIAVVGVLGGAMRWALRGYHDRQ